MRSSLIFRFLVFCVLALFSLHARAQDVRSLNYTSSDGLASNNVYCVYSDSRGFMWFGTDQGVSRFDGRKFTNFTTDNGLPDNDVFIVQEDRMGNIWFGTQSPRLTFFNGDSILEFRYNDSLSRIMVNRSVKLGLYFGRHGDVYLSDRTYSLIRVDTSGNITQYGGHECNIFDFGDRVMVGQIRKPRNKNLFVQGFRYFKAGGDFPVLDSSFIPVADNRAKGSHYCLKLASGKILLIKSEFIWTIDADTSFFIESDQKFDCIFQDGMKNVWLGTYLHGAVVLNGEDLSDTVAQLFPGMTITSIASDFQGGTWLSTLGHGIYQMPELDFTSEKWNALPPGPFYEVENDKNESLFTITEKGEAFCWRHGSWKAIPVRAFDDEREVPALYFDRPSNSLFLKGQLQDHGDSCKYHIATIKAREEVEPVSYLFDILRMNDKILEIRGKGIYNNEDGRAIIGFNKYRGLHSVKAKAIYDDTLWLSTNLGIYVIDRDFNFVPFDIDELKLKQVVDICVVGKDLVFSMSDRTLLVRNRTGKSLYGRKYNIPIGITTSAVDEDGHLWLGTSHGLYHLNYLEGRPAQQMSLQSGVWQERINDIVIDGDSIIIACENGLEIFSRKHLLADPIIPPKLFVSILSLNQLSWSMGVDGIMDFDHSQKNIEVGFTKVSFTDPGNGVIEWRFAENGTEWQELDGDVVSFSKLPPGKYGIEARANDVAGVWSDLVKIDFRILPAWWQRNDVRLFASILILILVMAVFRIRISFIRNRAKREIAVLREKSDLEMRALRAQMNPHFVFNSLTSIQYLINEKKTDEAEFYLNKFSRLLRMVVDKAGQEEIGLMEEIDLLRIYIDLENLRYDGKFDLNLELSDEMNPESIIIPAMVIQPFVENAIEHGLSKLDHKGELSISVQPVGDMLRIEVKDNGIGRKKARSMKEHSHSSSNRSIGVYNVRKRISLLNLNEEEEKYTLTIEDLKKENGEAAGTRVLLNLPLKTAS